MKKGRVVSVKKLKLTKYFEKDSLRFFISILFLLGLVLGICLFSDKTNSIKVSNALFKKMFLSNSEKITSYFSVSLFLFLFVDLVFLFFGVSIIGIIVIPLLITAIGYLIGGLLSYTFFEYSLKGIAFNSVVILPCFILYVIALIFISKYLFGFSLALSRITVKKDKTAVISIEFSKLMKKFIILLIATLFISVINSLICRYLIGLFEL